MEPGSLNGVVLCSQLSGSTRQVHLKRGGLTSLSACCTRPLQALVEGEEYASIPFCGVAAQFWRTRNAANRRNMV
jgi:hypothetical protein